MLSTSFSFTHTHTHTWTHTHTHTHTHIYIYIYITNSSTWAEYGIRSWCNGCRRRKWTRRHEFKSWTRLIAFRIPLIPLGKVWIQLFSLQLWLDHGFAFYLSISGRRVVGCTFSECISVTLNANSCSIVRCMQKHRQHNNDKRTHFFRKIYLLHFIRNGCESVVKRLCVRGELETEQSATYWRPVPLSLAALLFRSAGLLNRGSWRLITLCCVLVHSIASYLQLDWLQLPEPVCGPCLYNCLTAICFLWASHLLPIQLVHSQG